MPCPYCGGETAASGVCTRCGTSVATELLTPTPPSVIASAPTSMALGSEDDQTRSGHTIDPASRGDATGAKQNYGPLAPGTAFGGRYHVIRLLGMGGMGAVYQAWDDELGEAVAIKVIRPEITDDPGAARDIERRFKRELLIARQVTHRGVVRIHDLGEIDGIKFITMPYINGADLATILKREGRLPVRRALAIARQVVAGLKAAHEAGVIHRDLKPANIMIDPDDTAVIMDFGIARSVSGAGATVAGAVVGTLEYMAPEQAMAQPVDHRADIYSFGLIMYDMLAGRRESSRAESAVAELMQRMTQPLAPLRSREPGVPEAFEAIVMRCLAVDPAGRYQATAALEAALAALDADGHALAGAPATQPVTGPFKLPVPPVVTPAQGRRAVPWTWIAVGLAAFAAIATTSWVLIPRPGGSPGPASAKTLSLAILPFRNASGDASLDWLGASLADMIKTEVGQSRGLRVVPSDRVFQILRDLRISPDTELDASTMRRLVEFSNAELVITGHYARFGSAIRVDASVQGPARDTPIILKADAGTEADVPRAVRTLAGLLKDNLALTPAAAGAARSSAAGPTSTSMPALKAYTEGIQLARQGNHLEALKKFKAATEADPSFALAYAKLAQSYANSGYDKDAEQAARQAFDLSDKLPPEQRYLVLATRARAANDPPKAIEAYESLAKITPDDSQVLFDLASLYESTGSFDKAGDALARVLERDPKYADALFAMGRVEIRRRNPQAALAYLQRSLDLAIQTENQEAKGSTINSIGICYKLLGKPEEALRYYKEALEIRRAIGDKRGVGGTLTEIGQVQRRLKRPDAAVASYKEALAVRKEIGDKRGVANTLNDLAFIRTELGEYEEALSLFKESLQIYTDVGNENYQSLTLNNMGNIFMMQSRYDEALTYYERALQLREKSKVATDIADTLHNIGETLSKTGQYDNALSRYLRALELRRSASDRRGAAMESLSMGALFEQQARYAAALDAREEALKTSRELKDNSFLAEVLIGYGNTLVLIGRGDQARKVLDEGLALASELKKPRSMALALSAQADSLVYRGQFKTARPLFERATQVSSRSTDRDIELAARINLAMLDVKDGRARPAIDRLKELTRQANALRLRPLAAEGVLNLGEALLATKDLASARRELESALDLNNKLGRRAFVARAHHLLGLTLRQSGDSASATRHLTEARQIVEALRKEARTDDLLTREDLGRILKDAPQTP